MNINLERLKNAHNYLKSCDDRQVEGIKNFAIFAIVFSLIGIYWFLKLKTLGMALVLVCVGFLAYFLFLHRDDPKTDKQESKPPPPPKPKQTKEKKKDDKKETDFISSLGMSDGNTILNGLGGNENSMPNGQNILKNLEKSSQLRI